MRREIRQPYLNLIESSQIRSWAESKADIGPGRSIIDVWDALPRDFHIYCCRRDVKYQSCDLKLARDHFKKTLYQFGAPEQILEWELFLLEQEG